MSRPGGKTIALLVVAIGLGACASPPASTRPLTPTSAPPMPAVTVAAPDRTAPTLTAPSVSPTDRVRPATVTNTPAAIVSPTSTAVSPMLTNPPPTAVPTSQAEADTGAGLDSSEVIEANAMNIRVGDEVLTATLAENTSVDALKEALAEGPISVDMRDYGNMEKVGPLGMDLPRNDEQITTEAGDIILFQGSALVIYYAPNSWNFTRLGRIENVTADELREILGEGNVTVELALQ